MQLPNEVGVITSSDAKSELWMMKIVQGGLPGDGTHAIAQARRCRIYGPVLLLLLLIISNSGEVG